MFLVWPRPELSCVVTRNETLSGYRYYMSQSNQCPPHHLFGKDFLCFTDPGKGWLSTWILNSNAILTALDIFFRFEEIGCSVEHWQIQITTDDEMRRLIQCVHCDLAGSNLTRPPDYKCFNVKEWCDRHPAWYCWKEKAWAQASKGEGRGEFGEQALAFGACGETHRRGGPASLSTQRPGIWLEFVSAAFSKFCDKKIVPLCLWLTFI